MSETVGSARARAKHTRPVPHREASGGNFFIYCKLLRNLLSNNKHITEVFSIIVMVGSLE